LNIDLTALLHWRDAIAHMGQSEREQSDALLLSAVDVNSGNKVSLKVTACM